MAKTRKNPDTTQFQKVVWDFYENNQRDLPWRPASRQGGPPALTPDENDELDPYRVLISEIMLQQTQAARVVPKYEALISEFPNFHALANAPLKDVLLAWQGLGYNRRAKFLHQTAQTVAKEYGGELPRNEAQLLNLPGIGPYTAGAIQAFAYNQPVVFIETNIRTVFLYHFFDKQNDVADTEIKHLVKETMSKDDPREWYYALMDYGAHLKRTHGNPNKRSKHYTKQSAFAGSNRELRSQILKYILKHEPVARDEILQKVQSADHSTEDNLAALESEGFIACRNNTYRTAD